MRKGNGHLKHDSVGRFWVVTYPTPHSELVDICFESTVLGMANQFRGGLYEDEVYGLYTSHAQAERAAESLLKSR